MVKKVWTALLFAFLLALATDAEAAGRIVDGLKVDRAEDAIPGVTFGEVPYVEYRGRFQGSLTLPYDATGTVYAYDMPVWIIAPANLADGNGSVVLDPFHTNAVTSIRPSGSEGEQPLALKQLGPRFLFRSGTRDGSPAPNYTWVGVRWDPRCLTTPVPQARYDHVYEQRNGVSPGTLSAPGNRAPEVGKAMLADLADALRGGVLTMRGEEAERPFAAVERVTAFGVSQIGRLLRQLLNDPPSTANGGGVHHVPLFDGWFIGGAAGTYERWPTISAAGVVTPRPPILRLEPTPPENGRVIELASEQDIGRTGMGNEFVRFGDTPWYRSYEIAGASHFGFYQTAVNGLPGATSFLPDLADSLDEVAAISGVAPDFTPTVIDAFFCVEEHPLVCTNPLNWNPVVRALFTALDEWIQDSDALPPPSMWLLPEEGEPTYGDASIARDAVGNALGGIQLPDVAVGRGRFYATSPDFPPAGGNVFAGAYIDRHDRFAKHGHYVSAFAKQADWLVAAGFLLPDDHDLLIASAAMSRVGKK